MDKYSPGRYDPVSGNYFPADLGKTNEEAANLANTKLQMHLLLKNQA